MSLYEITNIKEYDEKTNSYYGSKNAYFNKVNCKYTTINILNSNRLSTKSLLVSSNYNFCNASNISTYSITGNYTLTPAQVVNGILCVHTQPSNFLLPTSNEICNYIQSNVSFTILAGFTFHFKVSVLANSLGVQIDTTDGGLFCNKLITVEIGTLATTRSFSTTNFLAVYDGTVFNYY